MWSKCFSIVLLALNAHADLTLNGQPLTVATKNSAQISAKLITAAQPTADDLAVFAKAGVKVVIDLRAEQEDRGFNEIEINQQLGLQYVKLPIAGSDDINFENAKKLDQLLTEHQGQNVLLHCASSNRVGALLALRAKQQGASNEEALAAGRAAGMKSLESRVMALLSEK